MKVNLISVGFGAFGLMKQTSADISWETETRRGCHMSHLTTSCWFHLVIILILIKSVISWNVKHSWEQKPLRLEHVASRWRATERIITEALASTQRHSAIDGYCDQSNLLQFVTDGWDGNWSQRKRRSDGEEGGGGGGGGGLEMIKIKKWDKEENSRCSTVVVQLHRGASCVCSSLIIVSSVMNKIIHKPWILLEY